MTTLRHSRGLWWLGRRPVLWRLVLSLTALVLIGVLLPGIEARTVCAQSTEPGEIEGHTRALNGDPVSMMVYFYLQTSPTEWKLAGASWSDDSRDGAFSSPNLEPGRYRIQFEATTWYLGEYWDDKSDFDLADAVTVAAGQTTVLPDVFVSPAGVITGEVTGPGGAPLDDIADVCVIARNPDWSQVWPFEVISGHVICGQYELGGLKTGDYYLEFYDLSGRYATMYYNGCISEESADLLHVTAGQTLTNINQVLPLAGRIAGTVRSESGALLDSISVIVYASDGSGGCDVVASESTWFGSYTIRRLPPGEYKVAFRDYANVWATQYYKGKPSLDAADYVTVTSEKTTIVNATLVPAPPPSTRYEQSSPLLSYTVPWVTDPSSTSYSGGSQKTLSRAGAVNIKFTGTGIHVLCTKGPSYGIMKVTLDGVVQSPNVNLYAATPSYKQDVFHKSGLANTTHTLKLEYTGTKHSGSSGYTINLDALDVEGTLVQAP